MNGGADEIRTRDLLHAMQSRSQLRHGPTRAGRGSSLANSSRRERRSPTPWARVYTILCNCHGKIRAAAPYDSADAASLGALADGVHQSAQAIRLLLLRGR